MGDAASSGNSLYEDLFPVIFFSRGDVAAVSRSRPRAPPALSIVLNDARANCPHPRFPLCERKTRHQHSRAVVGSPFPRGVRSPGTVGRRLVPHGQPVPRHVSTVSSPGNRVTVSCKP